MKKSSSSSLAVLTSIGLLTSLLAQAQVVIPEKRKVDQHPYQSQTMIYLLRNNPLALSSTLALMPFTGLDHKPRNVISTTLKEQVAAPGLIAQGGNFAWLSGNTLQTVSADGLVLTSSGLAFTPDVIGGTYFTKKNSGELVVIDSSGFYFETGMLALPSMAGGNFFISTDLFGRKSITTIRSQGMPYVGTDGVIYAGWTGMPTTYNDDMSQVTVVGGNYFVNANGTIGTIDSLHGTYYNNLVNDSVPATTGIGFGSNLNGLGGNYFIGKDHILYTIDFLGNIKKFSTVQTAQIRKLGYSYIEFTNETLLTIDYKGNPHASSIEFPLDKNGSITEMGRLPSAAVIPAPYRP